MPRIAQISDLHLQSTVPARQAQIEPILQAINDAKPDLVVISGDVTDDGWDSIDELRWAKDWLDERIDGEWFAVPGNHDVGNFASLLKGQINANRAECWESVFGLNHCSNYDPWCVIGYCSMYFGSDIEKQVDQDVWLASIIKKTQKQRIAIFQHSPLFAETIKESIDNDLEYWLGPWSSRRHAWKLFSAMDTNLIASGHVHQTRLAEVDGVHITWAPPASGTWVHAPGLPNPPMPDQTGYLMHHLGDDGSVRTEIINCAPMLKLYRHNP